MKTNYKHIHFVQLEQKPKTSVWACCNNHSLEELGKVEWYGSWRQYCYFPNDITIYSVDCLEDINDFIRQLKELRK